jgi:hypothetical protein
MYQFLSQPSQRHHPKVAEIHRHKTRAIKIMVTENRLYNTTNTIHNAHYSKQITQKFTAA